MDGRQVVDRSACQRGKMVDSREQASCDRSVEELSGAPGVPDAKIWIDYVNSLKRDAPNRYEDAAKFLATIIALTTSILFTLHEKLQFFAAIPAIVFAILFVWLVALFCAFMVIFPSTYMCSPRDVDAIKEIQKQIVWKKRRYFTWSVWLYFVPLALMVVSYAAIYNFS